MSKEQEIIKEEISSGVQKILADGLQKIQGYVELIEGLKREEEEKFNAFLQSAREIMASEKSPEEGKALFFALRDQSKENSEKRASQIIDLEKKIKEEPKNIVDEALMKAGDEGYNILLDFVTYCEKAWASLEKFATEAGIKIPIAHDRRRIVIRGLGPAFYDRLRKWV